MPDVNLRILLRYYGQGHWGEKKEYVNLPGVPSEGDEIHWDNRIVKVLKVIWFPGPNEHGPVACLNVEVLS